MAGRVVVITGASSGIGAALAVQLGAQRDRLVLGARRERELKDVASRSGEALAVVADVTRRGDVDRLRDSAIDRFGQIDVWVNNAGRGINRHVADLSDDDVHDIIQTVLMSALYGMQSVLPHFKERGRGHIINVSSLLGRVPVTTHRSIYSAAKSALNVLSANLRMDLKAEYPGINVSVVLPGIVDTPFHDIAGPPLPARAGGQLGQTRIESAEEVAAKVASLIDSPVPELYTNPGARDFVESYFRDVGAFEEEFSRRAQRRPATR